MKALLVPVGEIPRSIEVSGELKDLQGAVGGTIDSCSWLFDDKPSIYINDNGKFDCPPNRVVYATAAEDGCVTWNGKHIREGDVLDILHGNFIAVGFNPETGEDRDITDEEVARVMERFGEIPTKHELDLAIFRCI